VAYHHDSNIQSLLCKKKKQNAPYEGEVSIKKRSFVMPILFHIIVIIFTAINAANFSLNMKTLF